jgi:ADP-dependent NAD(P)H-hydrate dehydratase / NAD(P)H-hydrate epimerase
VQILSAQQIRDWDQYTIKNEPIGSADLMERAAGKCVEWIVQKDWQQKQFHIFCGKGNNGGDGLVIARQLWQQGYSIQVHILESGKIGSEDFQTNLQRLHDLGFTDLSYIQSRDYFPTISSQDIIIDALFGSGLNNPLNGIASELVSYINQSGAIIVAIDLPSGLFIDASSQKNTVVEADHTLTFQCMKLSLLMRENAQYIGEVILLDIGLHPAYLDSISTAFEFIDAELIKSIYRPRNAFAHKGTYGHALLIGGSYGKIGAIQLAVKACLRSGAGLTTAFIPQCGYQIMQTALPEAMVIADKEDQYLSALPDDIEKYNAIGIGPGMGTKSETIQLLSFILRRFSKPVVIDADGLNCLAQEQDLLLHLPACSILTPHPKEFERLFGTTSNDFERIELARIKAKELNTIIVLKSHHTLIALPGGMCYFNSTGNAGMAKGGSGDVLTGIITALLAQGYPPEQAAILGVYLHGLAGDLAAEVLSTESMLASDIIMFLSKAFKQIGS